MEFPLNGALWADHRAVVDDMWPKETRPGAAATEQPHIGEWMGLPATGKYMDAWVALLYRLADDKIVEGSAIPDEPESHGISWARSGGLTC